VHVEISYSIPPAECATEGDNIAIPEIYANALLDYVMFRAFSKDSEYSDPGKAAKYYQMFGNALGVKIKIDTATAPNPEQQNV